MPDFDSDPLHTLITLLQETLNEIRQGRMQALDRMDQEFQCLFEQLPAPPDDPAQRMTFKTRLKTLARLRAHLENELKELKAGTAKELGKVSHGRRSVSAYQKVMTSKERGAKRGEG